MSRDFFFYNTKYPDAKALPFFRTVASKNKTKQKRGKYSTTSPLNKDSPFSEVRVSKQVTNLMFYAQSTITVISGRKVHVSRMPKLHTAKID